MGRQIEEFLDKLDEFGLPIFSDDVAEDEEEQFKNEKVGYNFFVYETGNIEKLDGSKTVVQDLTLFYYSEKQDDLDEKTIDIITKLASITTLHFKGTVKERLRKKETDKYVDLVVFSYTRSIPLGCVLL